MKIKNVTFNKDQNGEIRFEKNRVILYLDIEKGGTVLLFCEINPNEHTIKASNVSFEGLWCPCCDKRNMSICPSLYSKKDTLLREAYDLLEQHSDTNFSTLTGPLQII
ncbi:hypothetical protein NKR74_08525 [Bacillus sp. 3103sda1]|uniref:hypothetical protein n=1 Tax=Bacillus sp. 3103sda1 TaxID=2953808 RepID=UPI0020A1769C|nr:hypothetical protein [Bacillus sp. 3103sda1]MCP1123373.1 hypothetical protein [Bacillus sp. 3103sda1]